MEKVRVLLVEDDDSCRQLLGTILKSWGYEVLEFPDPTCVACVQPECPCDPRNACADILLTDQMMPGITGVAFLEAHSRKGCPIPPENRAIITAADDIDKLKVQAGSATFEVFRKPYNWAILRKWLEECASRIPPDRDLLPARLIGVYP